MKINKIISAVGVGIAIILSVVGLAKNSTNSVKTIVRGTTPEISSPYLIVNGVTQWYANNAFLNASSTGSGATLKQTLCSIPAPLGTSSLEFVSWNVTTATGTASTIEIATSSSPFSTTTQLVSTSVGAGVVTSKRWTPVGGSVDDSIFYVSTSAPVYVNVVATGAATALGGYTYAGGYCNSLFDQM